MPGIFTNGGNAKHDSENSKTYWANCRANCTCVLIALIGVFTRYMTYIFGCVYHSWIGSHIAVEVLAATSPSSMYISALNYSMGRLVYLCAVATYMPHWPVAGSSSLAVENAAPPDAGIPTPASPPLRGTTHSGTVSPQCGEKVSSAYSWAKWVIFAGFLAILWSIVGCVFMADVGTPRTKLSVILAILLVSVAWIAVCLAGDFVLYKSFFHITRGGMCD